MSLFHLEKNQEGSAIAKQNHLAFRMFRCGYMFFHSDAVSLLHANITSFYNSPIKCAIGPYRTLSQ